MIDLPTLSILGALLLTVVSMIVTAVWTVGSVRTTTAVLAERIDNLREAIANIVEKLGNYGETVRRIEHRVTLLEQKINGE